MSAMPKLRLTVAEYLARERRAEFKSEFFQGEMFAMAGASRRHNRINENLTIRIGSRLLNGPCQTFSRDLRVRIERTGLFTYPDLVIVCGEPEFAAEDPDTLINPNVIVEILSDSTESRDRTTKFDQYKNLHSFREYVLVSQKSPICERYRRNEEGDWVHDSVVGLDKSLVFATVPIQVPLAEIYAGLEFPDSDGVAETPTDLGGANFGKEPRPE
jgi:Uma2 family endonuclease